MKRWLPVPLVLILAVLACVAGPAVPILVTVAPPAAGTRASSTLPPATVVAGSHAVEPIPLQAGYGARGSFYEVYFTDPFSPGAGYEEGGPDQPLAQAIDEARISVDMAAYSLSLPSIRNALLAANNRGVRVRVVMESTNLDDEVPQQLAGAGIPLMGDGREGLMHDKFVVIDRSEVWMGSMNFTTSGTYADNNNLVRIHSTQVAEDYTVEFEEMFLDDMFGPDAVAVNPHPTLTIDGIPLEIYFSPDDGVAAHVLELLRGAKKSIYFMAYSFTADDFGAVMRQKAQEGLIVSGVMEKDQVASNKGTEYDPFVAAGLQVYQDGNPGQMHHKVIIIDDQIVVTGSYNFSLSAEKKNDENVVIFVDPAIAAQYLAEFERVLRVAQQ